MDLTLQLMLGFGWTIKLVISPAHRVRLQQIDRLDPGFGVSAP
jgi:hypothetical protein